MTGTAIKVDSLLGVINIEKVTGDIEITATSKKMTDLINVTEAYNLYVCNTPSSSNTSLIQEKLFNSNIDERREL